MGASMIRHTTLLAIILAAALSVVLFGVKYQVRDLEEELTSIERAILNEERAIHVLRAEWSHLNDPERLRQLAARYLDLSPVTARQLGSFDDLGDRVVEVQPGLHPASVSGGAQ
jgi:cell division protein FtsL